MYKIILVSLSFIFVTPISSLAKGAPQLGDVKAFAYQKCGKDITLQIGSTADGRAVIGLNNKKTQELDLFVTPSLFDFSGSYSQFVPVKFDAISKSLIDTGDKDIDIVWGSAYDENKKTHHRLALGNYIYECATIVPWPKDKANDLYGEPSVDTNSEKSNATHTEDINSKLTTPVKQSQPLNTAQPENTVATKPKT